MAELPPVYTEKAAPGAGLEPAVHAPTAAPETITLPISNGAFDEQDPQWQHCCTHLRTAAKIIGWVHVVVCVLSLMCTVGTIVFIGVTEGEGHDGRARYWGRHHSRGEHHEMSTHMMYWMMAAASALEALLLVVYCVMLRGVYTGRKAYVVPFLVLGVLLGLLTFGIIFAAIELYVTYVMMRFYRLLSAKERANVQPQHMAYVYMPPPQVQVLNNTQAPPPAYEQQNAEPQKIPL